MGMKLCEYVAESRGKELASLLDEGRSGRGFIRIKVEILQKFMVDAAALHTNTETNHLSKPQLTITREILGGIFDKERTVGGHRVDDGPKSGFNFLRE